MNLEIMSCRTTVADNIRPMTGYIIPPNTDSHDFIVQLQRTKLALTLIRHLSQDLVQWETN